MSDKHLPFPTGRLNGWKSIGIGLTVLSLAQTFFVDRRRALFHESANGAIFMQPRVNVTLFNVAPECRTEELTFDFNRPIGKLSPHETPIDQACIPPLMKRIKTVMLLIG